MITQCWNVIYTRPKTEVQVFNHLKKKGVEVFLPLAQAIVQWSDRKKKMQRCLFPNYVFIKISSAEDKATVFEAPGFIRFVSTAGKPDLITEEEIDTIRLLLTNSPQVVIQSHYIGESVMITNGFFKGMTGKLVRRNGTKKFVVHLKCLKQYLAVEISSESIEKIAPEVCYKQY